MPLYLLRDLIKVVCFQTSLFFDTHELETYLNRYMCAFIDFCKNAWALKPTGVHLTLLVHDGNLK